VVVVVVEIMIITSIKAGSLAAVGNELGYLIFL
jgi:hypothetical protein